MSGAKKIYLILALFVVVSITPKLWATEINTTAVNKALKDMLDPSGRFSFIRFSDGTRQTTSGSLSYTPPNSTNQLCTVDPLRVNDGNTCTTLGSASSSFYISTATASVNDVMQYNGSKIVWGPPAVVSVSGDVEYFNATPVIISGTTTNNTLPLLTLSTTPVTTTEQIATSTTNAATTTAFVAWRSSAIGATSIPAGIWGFQSYVSVDSVSGGRSTTLSRVLYVATPGTPTVTITGTGLSRTATFSAGTPVTGVIGTSTNTNASFLETPQGLYQFTGTSSATVGTILVPSGYSNEAAVSYKIWNKILSVTSSPITSITTVPSNPELKVMTSVSDTISLGTTSASLGAISFMTSATAGATTLSLYYNGTTHNSHFDTPIVGAAASWGGLSGVPTDSSSVSTVQAENKLLSGIPDTYSIDATTTAITGTTTYTRYYNLQSSATVGGIGTDTILLLHCDNPGSTTFTNSSTSYSALTYTANGNAIGTSTSPKFGTGAYLGDGTGDFLRANGTSSLVFTGDFTIEGWINTSSTAELGIWGTTNESSWTSDAYAFEYQNTSLFFYTNGATFLTATTPSLHDGNWHHVALVRSGSNIVLYADGNQYGIKSFGATTLGNATFRSVVGAQEPTGSFSWNGKLDEVAVYNTAKYTGTFTVRTTPYEVDTTYTYNNFSVVPAGTTTSYLSIIDDGTHTAKLKVVIGGVEYSTSSAYFLDVSGGSILGRSFVSTPSNSSVKTLVSSSPEEEVLAIYRNSQAHKFYFKNKEVSDDTVDTFSLKQYEDENYKSEFNKFKDKNIDDYTTEFNGSSTVNNDRMQSDFEVSHKNKMKAKWNDGSVANKSDRIIKMKTELEKDSNDSRNNTPSYGIVLDRNCPKEITNADGLPDLVKWEGMNYTAIKGLIDKYDALVERIEVLEASQ
jgi:hypothetical protein